MSIFAALDQSGGVRFVGEVDNGVACGCFCPVCASPLLAKQGELNAWHFAHQPGQERPECEPGSINLLRRLAIEGVMELASLQLPEASLRVTVDARFPALCQVLNLHYGPATAQQWYPQAPKLAKVADFLMMDQTALALYVEIGPGDCALELDDAPGALLFCVPLPSEGQIRTEEQARDYLKQSGSWHWRRVPDVGRRVERAKEKLLARRAPLLAQYERTEQLRRQQLMEDRIRGQMPRPDRLEVAPMAQPEPEQLVEMEMPQWVSWKKDRTSFYAFARPKEEAIWVVFSSALHDGYFIVPAPVTFDGWDESLPPTLGYVDHKEGAIVGPGPVSQAVGWFYGNKGVQSRIDSDATQILRFAHEVAKP